jgi:predicted CoA-substrate-specific enzyme activase
MAVLGIDIGSRTIARVVLEHGRLVESQVIDSGPDPVTRAVTLAGDPGKYEAVVSTGYGRHAMQSALSGRIITEIRAHALGAGSVVPGCRTVLDIGGQDSKVIRLDAHGNVEDFLMNDKCAAGTGRFLEVMARTLNLSLAELGEKGGATAETVKINSMCTVFAESEVVSLLANGTPVEVISRALLASICDKVTSMLNRIGVRPPLVFTGGVARFNVLAGLIGAKLKQDVVVPPDPQIIGALGAALYAESGEQHGT